MKPEIENLLNTLLQSDSSIGEDQKRRALSILKGEDEPHKPGIGKLYTRKEAAEILRKSPQCVDYYCRKGWLAKTVLGGQQRASGVAEEDLIAFMKGERSAVQK